MIRIFHWRFEPARLLYTLNAFIALLVAYGLPLKDAEAVAITVIATGVLSILVALQTRPIVVSGIAAAASTILTAVAAFGWELSPEQISSGVAFGSVLLGFVVREYITPPAKLKARAGAGAQLE
jgi:hypothetical protein